MSGITKILTRTPSELGSIKTNKSPIIEESKQLPAEQWNTAADAIIEIQTVIGETANPATGTITEVLSDHEERIDELEQSGGGGSSSRIESPSGVAVAEATDDAMLTGSPGVVLRTTGDDGFAGSYAAIIPTGPDPEDRVYSAAIGAYDSDNQGVAFAALFDPGSDTKTLEAQGAPLRVEEPTAPDHAATKAYVDGAAPAKIELAGSRVEVLPNGDIEMWRDGQRRLRVANTNVDPSIALSTTNGSSITAIRSGGSEAELYAGNGTRIGVEVWNSGRVYLYSGGAKYFLAVNGDALPAGVESVVQAARRAYERRADVEWWEPVWTPVSNVDSVSNVECSYTRTYRAAGGSLVTIEGTIEVTPEAADTMTMVSVGLPVPRVGVDIVAGIGSFTDYDGDDFGVARVGVADLGAGQQVSVQYTPSTNAVHRVSFRISYRAA